MILRNGTDEKLGNTKLNVISYSEHILSWLEKCRKEAASLPIIRETIAQYIQLINYLTGKSINKAMENDLANKISKSPEYISSAFTIYNTLVLVQKKLLTQFVLQLDDLAKDLKLDGENEHLGETPESYYWFRLPDSKYEAAIGFGFEQGLKFFKVGILFSEDCDKKSEEIMKVRKEVSDRLSFMYHIYNENINWVFLHHLVHLANWSKSENWEKIATEKLKSEIKEILEKILKALNGVEL